MKRSPAQQRTRHIFIQLPLMEEVIAIYTQRHSQVDELLRLAYSYGYTEEQVTVFLDEEDTVTALEKREGYVSLLQSIREGNITVIFLLNVAQLFTNATQEELDTFIVAGMSRGIYVVTPQGIFSFSHLTLIVAFRATATKAFAELPRAF